MADWQYRAIDADGAERSGAIAADDRASAEARLAAQALYLLSLTKAAGTTAGDAPRAASGLSRHARLPAKALALFTRQLATLSAVSPLEEALRTAARQSEDAATRTIITTVQQGVLEGRRLADAMAREPRSFPALYRAMIAAGETSGTLPDILIRLADLLERQAAVRGKLVATLAYPVVLAFVALAVVASLMIWVVPRVVEQFDTVGQQLPLLTRIVIALSDAAANYWWLALLAMAAIGGGVTVLLRRPGPRLAFDTALLRVPLVGRIIRDLHAARFARTLGTMVASRLPLVEGLRLTLPTINNRALANATATLVEQVRGGGTLSGAMRQAGVFPPLLVYLAASGESSGRLEQMLASGADYLEREFDRFTATSMALIEPAIIVIMGAVVTIIVLAILLPILQLQQLTGL